ncbi:hypothetical protein EVAR_67602_1 [Eumeta japonica]|uniref:Uncharacterized protein n=1 Tax=Eumeta variegata TaxID=151549 RepID=A0A4C1ZPH1_EUMVA|nr:hypothetical protein EVAR_67602_1 [Eumeta japonica]
MESAVETPPRTRRAPPRARFGNNQILYPYLRALSDVHHCEREFWWPTHPSITPTPLSIDPLVLHHIYDSRGQQCTTDSSEVVIERAQLLTPERVRYPYERERGIRQWKKLSRMRVPIPKYEMPEHIRRCNVANTSQHEWAALKGSVTQRDHLSTTCRHQTRTLRNSPLLPAFHNK